MAATDAKPIPKKNAIYRHYFTIRKNDGTVITTWTGMDSERSIDGATMSDCTNEATEIATNSGCGYIDLTATEMNSDCTVLKVTVTNTDALPYVVALFPVDDGDIPVNVTQVSDDATAAANLELMYDGTGYAGGTTKLGVNLSAIAGSGTAATNAKAAYDGSTGYGFTGCTIPTVTTLTGHTAQTGDTYALANGVTGFAAIDTVVDGIQADLDNGTDGLGAIKTETAAILADTAEIGAAGAGLTALPWNAAWDAEVESEVNDAIDTAISELGVGAPTATPTIRTAIMLLYMALRNKTVVQTSGTDALEIYNDAGTKIASKALTDDGSDYTEAEMISG